MGAWSAVQILVFVSGLGAALPALAILFGVSIRISDGLIEWLDMEIDDEDKVLLVLIVMSGLVSLVTAGAALVLASMGGL